MKTIQEITLELWNNLNCARSAACGILLYYGFEQECNTLSKALIPFGDARYETWLNLLKAF